MAVRLGAAANPAQDAYEPGGADDRAGSLALFVAGGVLAALVAASYAGSRGFKDFDPALLGYTIGTFFAAAGLAYRTTLWLSRPQTRRYLLAGGRAMAARRRIRRTGRVVPRAIWTDLVAQTYILRRSPLRWVMHLCLSWGVLLSLAMVVPLTMGWMRFTLDPPLSYRVWVVGIETVSFPLETPLAWIIFHFLDFTAVLLLVGVAIALWRRCTDRGLVATQRFGFDIMPLVLLAAIGLTGLALTVSASFWEGRYYSFISLTHQVIVVGWLMLLPFGKFFHVVQRPATIGVRLYQAANDDDEAVGGGAGSCRRCGDPLPSAQFIADLQATLDEVGQRYELGGAIGNLQAYCPTCKRKLRGQAYYARTGNQFV